MKKASKKKFFSSYEAGGFVPYVFMNYISTYQDLSNILIKYFHWQLVIASIVYLNVFLISTVDGQNLVPNHDFSDFTVCPDNGGEIYLAAPWYSPNGKTTDFIHICGTSGNTGVPINQWGFQRPAKGTGYAGIRAWLAQNGTEPRNYREYLAVELTDTLKAGKDYLVSFKISVGDTSRFVTDDIGLAFSDALFPNELIMPFTPDILNPESRILNNTYAWESISGRYTAKGGEKHIAIGCFKDDTEITLYQMGAASLNNSDFFNTVYLYIDEVIVEPCEGKFPQKLILAEDSILCPGEVLDIAAVPLEGAGYTWENSNSDTLRSVSTPGKLTLEVTFEGCVKKDSLEIRAEEVPLIELGKDTVLCPGETLQLSLEDTTLEYLWNNGTSQNTLMVEQNGTYRVETLVKNCQLVDSITVRYEEPLVNPIDLDTLICLQNTFTLRPAYKGYQYVWQDSSTNSTFRVSNPGVYDVKIQSTCFEVEQAFYLEGIDCGCVSTVANVFTPNGDGFNDVFLPEMTPGVTGYKLRVFDRWGHTVFSSQNKDAAWEGDQEGTNLTPGVYYWQLSYTCVNENTEVAEQKQGYVTLVR